MMQRQITHVTGTFAACAGCHREPRHYTAQGSTSQEATAFSAMGERHQLECACERRTGWCGSLPEAILRWERLGDTVQAANVLPLRVSAA